jgi:hypothetical protein
VEWISVKDRLPSPGPDGAEFLVVVRAKGGPYVEIGWFGDGVWLFGNVKVSKRYITHWMPLPEPPKEEV